MTLAGSIPNLGQTLMMAFAGSLFGLLYFAALRRTVALVSEGRNWFGPLAFTLGRVGAAVVFFGIAAQARCRFSAHGLHRVFVGAHDRATCGAEGRLMQGSPLTSTVLFHLGPIAITRPVVTTWAIMLALAVVCRLVTRRLRMHTGRTPSGA